MKHEGAPLDVNMDTNIWEKYVTALIKHLTQQTQTTNITQTILQYSLKLCLHNEQLSASSLRTHTQIVLVHLYSTAHRLASGMEYLTHIVATYIFFLSHTHKPL